MKRLFFLVSLLIICLSSMAQKLVIEGVSPNFYINHIIAPKENFYSIGRLYNQSPKVIAAFNNITMEKGLSIGQHVKIPLNEQNFATGSKTEAGEILVPVTHVVVKGENIFKIGTAHNVTAQSIREWNLLSSDNVGIGTALVVGHLKVKSESPLAANGKVVTQPVAADVAVQPAPTAPVVKEKPVVAATPPPVKEKNSNGTFSTIETKTTDEVPVVVAPKEEAVKPVANEVKEQPVVVKNTTVVEPAPKPAEPAPAKNDNPKGIDISGTSASTAEGAFSTVFTTNTSRKSLNTKTGEAATFKSTSGWQDKKYYVLMNDVTPGTILKVSSGNSKVVYAKVLGSIPEMKENNGLLLRISNSAASYLGIVDSKFPIEVSFYQ